MTEIKKALQGLTLSLLFLSLAGFLSVSCGNKTNNSVPTDFAYFQNNPHAQNFWNQLKIQNRCPSMSHPDPRLQNHSPRMHDIMFSAPHPSGSSRNHLGQNVQAFYGKHYGGVPHLIYIVHHQNRNEVILSLCEWTRGSTQIIGPYAGLSQYSLDSTVLGRSGTPFGSQALNAKVSFYSQTFGGRIPLSFTILHAR